VSGIKSIRDTFHAFAHRTADLMGMPGTFFGGLLLIIVWAALGPVFHYSDTWQLVINTSTTIITFLMVFLIQHTQNRDAKAMHLKLDELIRAVGAARTRLVHLEDLSEEELASLELEFQKLHRKMTDINEENGGQAL
jgi:low affinity Fe/Cu permease